MECYGLCEFLNRYRRDRRYWDLATALENVLPRTHPVYIKVRVCIFGDYMAEVDVYLDTEEWDRINAHKCKEVCKPLHCYRECVAEEGMKKCKLVCIKRELSKCYLRCMKEEYENAIWWLKDVSEAIEKELYSFGLIYEARYDSKEKPTVIKFKVLTKRVEDRWMLQ